MINTDKYEGHTPIGFWRVVGQGEPEDAGEDSQHTPYWMCFDKVAQGDSRADRNLIQDAPLLLEEVKRLRERLEVIEDFINDELRAFVNSNAFDHIHDAIEKKLEAIE